MVGMVSQTITQIPLHFSTGMWSLKRTATKVAWGMTTTLVISKDSITQDVSIYCFIKLYLSLRARTGYLQIQPIDRVEEILEPHFLHSGPGGRIELYHGWWLE